jgi:hypothetical protein
MSTEHDAARDAYRATARATTADAAAGHAADAYQAAADAEATRRPDAEAALSWAYAARQQASIIRARTE